MSTQLEVASTKKMFSFQHFQLFQRFFSFIYQNAQQLFRELKKY